MTEPLNLAGADLTGFDPIPSSVYDCTVFEVKSVEIEKEGGNLPQGTKGYSVQFAVQGGQYDNRRIWNNYWIPGADYDEDKRAKMLGMFARLLIAIGYSEEQVTSGSFAFDPTDAEGRECSVTVGIQPEKDGYPARNTVRNVKPRSANLAEAGLL